MALLSSPSSSFLPLKSPYSTSRPVHWAGTGLKAQSQSQSHRSSSLSFRRFSLSSFSSQSGQDPPKPNPARPDPTADDEWGPDTQPGQPTSIPDEWGEKSAPEPELDTKFTGPDPPVAEDEWGPDADDSTPTPPPPPPPPTTTTAAAASQVESEGEEEKGKERPNWELKKCLVDTVYGSDFGFRASVEVRAEASEIITQLEAANPNPNSAENEALLDGDWLLVYTAASELLPLIAVGSTPLLKVEQISQAIDTGNKTIENSTTLAGPLATVSFSATATFEVRTPSRIQVRFKEATFKPPEIKSRIDVPESVDVFGQRIPLSPLQQLLNPLQEAAAGISRTLYGLPPLKIPLPGERTESWLLITYLDEDLRICRGDGGGLFVLVREGSPLLEN